MKMEKGVNPQGRCMYCGGPIHYKDKFCALCGKPNDCWEEASQSMCGNCHAYLHEGDRFCRICGTRVGDGAYEPYQLNMECLYGPRPIHRKHACRECGHTWITCLMKDDEKYCPQCGGIADEVPVSPEEVKQYQKELMEKLLS